MDIGLDIGRCVMRANGSEEPVIPPVDPPAPGPAIAPLTGILDAANVVILGASIMDSSFGGNPPGPANGSLRAYAAAAGFAGQLWNYGVAGERIADAITRHAQAKAALSASQGSNLYIAHIGGNNVTGRRPYDPNDTDLGVMRSDYNTLMTNIESTGDTGVLLPLTKRLYGKEEPAYPGGPPSNPSKPYVIHGDPSTDQYGSKPFNENIVYDIIDQHCPEFRQGGVPNVNPYELVAAYPWATYDGVHGYGRMIAQYILSGVAARAKGLTGTESRAGTSLLFNFRQSLDDNTVGQANIVNNVSSTDYEGHPMQFGAGRYDGGFDHFVRTISTGNRSSASIANSAFSRAADTRFHLPALLTGIYAPATTTLTVKWSHLTPGDTVAVSFVGFRGNTGGNTSRYTLSGTGFSENVNMDSSSAAASNQGSFTPVTVPADGRIRLDCLRVPNSGGAYLNGVMLDFT